MTFLCYVLVREVAKIAADAMNNYLMYRQLLKCEFIPVEKVHPDTFKNAHRPFRIAMGVD